jgi:hypothetical protein
MDWTGLIIQDAADRPESLTACLQAIAHWRGQELGYDDLNAAMGLIGLIAVDPTGASPADWPGLARDWCLVEAARLYGFSLRPLHPQEAAPRLACSSEFHQHFVDSYAPLIRQALDHEQPVLAWRGWPAPIESAWGVLTHVAEDGVGFAGTVPGSGGRPLVLQGPSAQCYVVETAKAREPEPMTLLHHAVRMTNRALKGETGVCPGIVTGTAAYPHILDWIGQAQWATAAAAGRAVSLMAFFQAVFSARQSGRRFFERWQGHLDGDPRGACNAVMAGLQQVCDALESLGQAAAGALAADGAEPDAMLRCVIQRVEAAEQEWASELDRMARVL